MPPEVGSAASVFLNRQERQEVGRTECFGSELEFQEDVCLPSTSVDSSDSCQVKEIQGCIDFDHAVLDEVGLVGGTSPAISSSSPSSSVSPRHSDGSEYGEPTAFIEQAQVDSMVHLQHRFRREGADQSLAEFICSSWRGSTRDQYRYAWRSWSEWCNGHSLPKTGPTVGQFISYLWHLYEDRRMAWSSI